MPPVEKARVRSRTPAPSLRQFRLAAGLVVFTYVALHFVNHALGNASVEAMENGLALQKLLWQSPPGAILLYSALTTHMGLGFWPTHEVEARGREAGVTARSATRAVDLANLLSPRTSALA